MAKQEYIKCPRCELNYILKKDKYCSVCKQEMQVGGGDLDELDMELCPICKTNYIGADEIMCQSCMEERNIDPENLEGNEDWVKYVNREENDEYDDGVDEEVGDATIKDDFEEDDGLDDDDIMFAGEGEEEPMEDDEEVDEAFEDDFDEEDDFDLDEDEDDEDEDEDEDSDE